MKYLPSVVVAGAAALLWVTGAHAAASPHPSTASPRMTPTTFRIAVTGTPARGTTFWVAHGPLGGRFGVIQLHHESGHVYAARVAQPASESTTFTYLTAHGVQMVHGSVEPGKDVTVIRTLDSVTASIAASQTVRWSVPLG